MIPLLLALPATALAPAGETVAVQAGTIHRVADGEVLTGGATLLLRDGKIVSIGSSVELPAGTRVVDYGPDAVIVPGLVCADSAYGATAASPRTAAPTLRAIDNFDPYTPLLGPAKAGVTSVFLVPARARLVAGQGAVVKTSGKAGDARVVAESALLVGSITAEARGTPGYWEVPVPATVDVGLGVEQLQLPRSTMGAVVALEELLALQAGDGDLEAEYGREAAQGLRALVDAGTTWCMDADTPEEIRALLDFFGRMKLPLALEGASGAAELAVELAAAGVPVLAAPPLLRGQDFGKGEDAPWPRYDTISRLARAGVRVAIVPPRRAGPEDLWLAAGLAMRGGMSASEALRAITLTPAEILGVADRVGSLTPGKDADFVVLNGPPLVATTGVTATWVSGEIAWKPKAGGQGKSGATDEAPAPATVIEVEELYLGNGEILRPGQVLLQGGRIAEVGPRVGHPKGAVVVRGAAAMPGMIDSFGHLGLEGSEKNFSARFDLRRLVEPGDAVDRRVARAGVTTVNLGPRRDSNGSPTMAYKPADEDPERMVLAAPATWRMIWSNEIRASSGESVKKDLAKALEYKQKWEQYEKDLAAWDPAKAQAAEDEEKKDEKAEEDAADDKKDEAADKDEKKEEDKKESKKKDESPAPVTGEWNGRFGSGDEAPVLRVRLLERDLALEGTARIAGREPLFVLTGARAEAAVTLQAEGGGERAELALTLEGSALKGTWTEDGAATEVAVERTSDVYPVAGRPDRPRPVPVASPKGEPKPPGVDPDLEPLRQAMQGKGAIVVVVGHSDEILDCVAEFEKAGIRPVLWDAPGAARLAPRIRDRIAGLVTRRDLPELAAAGIPVAFYSAAEEGAVELPLQALAAIAGGMSPAAALRALTGDAASLLGLAGRVGTLTVGGEGDLLLLDGPPLEPATSVLRVWVSGEEVR